MTTRTAAMYAARATYGSMAYDTDMAQPLHARCDAPAAPAPKVQTYGEVKARAKAGMGAGSGWSVSPFAILGFLVATVMIVFLLLAYVRLTEANAQTAAIQQELTALQTEKKQLTVAYESSFSLEDVMEYATTQLGMVKPDPGQRTQVSTQRVDKAVILKTETPERESLFQSVGSFFRTLMEYCT